MKKTLLPLILMAFLCSFGCGELNEEDDDDNEENYPPDPNGWDTEGCSWSIEKSGDEKILQKASAEKADWEDCLPPKPVYGDNDNYDTLANILELYLGEYEDQNGNQYIIECLPNGYWEIPNSIENSRCAYTWSIPIRVRFSEETLLYEGQIVQNYPDYTKQDASLNFGKGNTWYLANKKYLAVGEWQWLFSSSGGHFGGDMIWKKVQ